MLERFRVRTSSSHVVLACALAVSGVVGVVLFRPAPSGYIVPVVIPQAIEVPVAVAVAPSGEPVDETGPPKPVPTTAVPCIDHDAKLTTDGERPILCWGSACWAYDGEPRWTPEPVEEPPVRKPLEEPPSVWNGNDGFEVCTGDRCTRVGPRLNAALAAARAWARLKVHDGWYASLDETMHPRATRDHRVVMFRGDDAPWGGEAWNVERDRRIELTPPPSYASRESGSVVGIAPIGDLLVVSWSACAGPCTRAIVVDRNGRNRGPEFESGEIVQQTRDRFVVLGELGAITVLDRGRARATDESGPTYEDGPAVRIDDHRIASLIDDGARHRLAVITDGRVRVVDLLPRCE